MISNFLSILSLTVKSRIQKDYSVYQRFIPIQMNPIYFIFINNTISILLSITISYFFLNERQEAINEFNNIIIIAIILILVTYSFISGSTSYKRTHFPILYPLFTSTPLSEKSIYLLLILEELILFFTKMLSFYSIIFILFCIGLGFSLFTSFTITFNLVTISIMLYIIGNRVFGEYQLYKIYHRIGIIRVLIYVVTATSIFLFGYIATKLISLAIKLIRPEFQEIHLLLNESYLTEKFDELKNAVTSYLDMITLNNHLNNFTSEYYVYIFTLPFILLILLMIIIIINPPSFDKNTESLSNIINKDLLDFYINTLSSISRKMKLDQNVLLNKDLETMLHKRWLISPQVFSAVIYYSENYFYLGIVTGLSTIMTDLNMFFSILLVFSIMSIFVHSYILYDEYPQVFSLSSEQSNIILLKSSPIGIKTLFFAKYYLLSLVLFLPTLITIIMCVVLLLKVNGYFYIPMLLICIVFIYLIAPIIQLYMSPYISKFNLDHIQEVGNTKSEKDLHDYMQGIPRSIILVPALLFSFINIIIPVYEVINNIHIIYLVFILIPIVIFFVIAINIIKKGLKYLSDKSL